jgi:hypothetical protein
MCHLILNSWVIRFSEFTASKRGFVLASGSPKTGLVNSLRTVPWVTLVIKKETRFILLYFEFPSFEFLGIQFL